MPDYLQKPMGNYAPTPGQVNKLSKSLLFDTLTSG